MDHTHCFDNGVLHAKLNNIDPVKDDKVYGLFPEFHPFMSLITLRGALSHLASVTSDVVVPIIAEVPMEWQVDNATRGALQEMILSRAQFLSEYLADAISRVIGDDLK
jgi:hypothetical protein